MSSVKITKKKIKLIALVILFFVLVLINPKKIFTPVRSLFSTIVMPVQKTFYVFSRGTADFFSFLGSIGDLKSENEKLYEENLALQSEFARLTNIKSENEELRRQLELLPREKFVLENCLVTGYEPSRNSWITLDKGTSRGIKTGMPAISGSGILIGRIEETSLNSSRVTLINNPNSSLSAQTQETKAKGVIKGNFGLGLVMEMISQSDLVKVGDRVVTSRIGGGYPDGLLVGKVAEVKESDDKLFQTAAIIPAVDFTKLKMVSIIKE